MSIPSMTQAPPARNAPTPDALLLAAFEEGANDYRAGLRDDKWRPALHAWLIAHVPRALWMRAMVAHCRGYREAHERANEGLAAVISEDWRQAVADYVARGL